MTRQGQPSAYGGPTERGPLSIRLPMVSATLLLASALTVLSVLAVMPRQGHALMGRPAPEISSPTWLSTLR